MHADPFEIAMRSLTATIAASESIPGDAENSIRAACNIAGLRGFSVQAKQSLLKLGCDSAGIVIADLDALSGPILPPARIQQAGARRGYLGEARVPGHRQKTTVQGAIFHNRVAERSMRLHP